MGKSVDNIVKQQLCVSCGSCEVICKKKAISFVLKYGMYVPQVDASICNDCGLCSRVCPSSPIDVPQTYGTLDIEKEDVDSYTVYAKNAEVRLTGTSGGVISQMIIHLLQQGLYKQAYVLKQNPAEKGLLRVEKITSANQVLQAAKSKYVPVSIQSVINDITEKNIADAIVVGTPCQILAIRNALSLTKTSRDNILFLGLFCERIMNYNVLDYYRYRFGDFSQFNFRDKQNGWWPGGTTIRFAEKQICVNASLRMQLKQYFCVSRCRHCFDGLNQLADISFGDCYLPNEGTMFGKSSIVVRTEKGKEAYEACRHLFVERPSDFVATKQSQELELKLQSLKRGIAKGMYLNVSDEIVKHIAFDEQTELETNRKMLLGANGDFKAIDYELTHPSTDEQPVSMQKRMLRRIKRLLRRIKRIFVHPSTYKIFIDGSGFTNRGDQLMLQATVQKARQYAPDAQLFVSRSVYDQNPSYSISNQLLPLDVENIAKKGRTPYATPNQMDMVLDISGFRFGDQWAENATDEDIRYQKAYYSMFSKPGCVKIFLPQAFGPFEKEATARMMREVASFASLLYARESISYKHLSALLPDNHDKLRMAPDFTHICEPAEHPMIQLPKNSYVIIIPNIRMISNTSVDTAANYIDCMTAIGEYLIQRGIAVVMLNHEGTDDEQLIQYINDKLSIPQLVVSNIDANEIKSLIKYSRLTISSRYHGAVSALTQRVPTLCTSWSHKYQELFAEHLCENAIIEPKNIDEAVKLVEDALENPSRYTSKKGCMEKNDSQTEQMWKEVFSYYTPNCK